MAAFGWLLAAAALALDPSAPYLIDRFSSEDGLPETYVTALLQSRDGYLWIGTQQGLARFDGVRFRTYRRRELPALASNVISSLAEDGDGTLWIATVYGGLTALHGERSTTVGTDRGLPSASIARVAVGRGGRLWLGTDAGAAVLEPPADPAALDAGWTPRASVVDRAAGLSSPLVWSFAEAPDGGSTWVGTRGGGLARVVDGRAVQPPTVAAAGERIRDLVADAGGIWVASERGLFRLAGESLSPPIPGLPDAPIKALQPSATGGLWVATAAGLAHLAADGRVIQLTEVGTPWIAAVLEDREGSLWLGTFGEGLLRLRERRAVVYGTEAGLPDANVSTIAADPGGRIWIGTRAGLARSVGERFESVALPGLDAPWISTLDFDAGGRLHFATLGGELGTYDVEERRVERLAADGLPPVPIQSSVRGADGTLWLATNGAGLLAVRDGQVRRTSAADGLPSDFVFVLELDAGGRLWVGTEKGAARQTRAGGPIEALADPELATGVSAILAEDDGSVWLGTVDAGLFRFADERLQPVVAPDCYEDETVLQLLDDGLGSLWLGTNRGLLRLPRRELEARARGEGGPPLRCTWLGVGDGMATPECTGAARPAAFRDARGRSWFATARGAVVVDPVHWAGEVAPPPVRVESAVANGAAVALPEAGALVLGPGLERLEIGFTALSFLAPERIRFRYRLAGFDRDWIDGRTGRSAVYTNVPPGAYRFQVLAASRDGAWNEEGATLALEVRPRFTETGWFAALLALATVSLAAGGWALRLRHLRSRFAAVLAERSRIAREIHDTLAQGLHGVSLFLQAAAAEIGSGGAAGGHLERARGLVEQSLDETRRSIFELRSRHFEGRDLLAAVEARVAEQVAGTGVAGRVSARGKAVALVPELEADVLRLVEEAVHNALRHAAARVIEVTLAYAAGGLEVAVADDGTGIATPSREGGFGLVGMQERAERWGGRLEVAPADGGGTRVVAFFPRREAP